MKRLFPIILVFHCYFSFSQVNLIWEKEIGGGEDDWGYGLCFSHDKQYVFTGITTSYDEEVPDSLGGTDVWFGKMSPDSILIWSYTFGGTANDRGNDVQLAPDHGFFITGFTESNDIDISENHGSKDLVVFKTDDGGHLEWVRVFGGTSDEIGNSVYPLANGNCIVAGSTFSTDGDISNHLGLSDYWVLMLDANGNLLWEKTFGGSSEDRAKKIIQTQDGNFVILGTTFSSDSDVSNNYGGVDFWLIKIDVQGNLIWEKTFGGSSADQGTDVMEMGNGDLVIAGEVLSNDGDISGNHGFTDAWIARLDSTGNLIWKNTLGGTLVDYFLAIHQMDDGGIIAVGNSFSNDGDVNTNLGASDVWMIKLSAAGNILWDKSIGYNLNEIGNDIITAGNDIIVLGGIQVNHLRHGNSDAYLVKLQAPLTSIHQAQSYMSIRLYPNPIHDILHVSNNESISEYIIFDMLGKEVLQGFPRKKDVHIPLPFIAKGKYTLVVSLESGVRVSVPFSK